MSQFCFFAYPPPTDLSPFVDSIWGVRGRGSHSTEAVLPNGAVELMINFGPPQAVVGRGNDALHTTYHRAWLAGMQDQRLIHSSEHGCDHIAVRFRPGGAHAFLPVPMFATNNAVIELEDLMGGATNALRDQLGDLSSDASRAAALFRWLRDRQRVHAFFPTALRAVAMLGASSARHSVAGVCEQLGLSNKHLVQQFRRTVGLSPKVLGRVLRLQSVIQACAQQQRVDWADLAYRHGYADQAHLSREFRRLGNVTPTAFLQSRAGHGADLVMS